MGVITDDHSCIHCGYNLRGLGRDGRCPECFTPIGQSVHGNLLRYADAAWLDKLRFGTVLKLWHIGLGILIIMTAGLFPLEAMVVLAVVGGGFGLWASFVITTQEPRISLREDPITWRKAVRVCATVGFVGFMGTVLQQAAKSGTLPLAVLVAAHALLVVGLVAMFGEFVYFRRFALRIPNPKLARSTRIVMWGSTISLGWFIAGGFTAAQLSAVPAGAPAAAGVGLGILASLSCFASLPLLVFFVWYLSLVDRYKTAFTKAAGESRELAAQVADTASPAGESP